jgi:translation initiation factor IF-2
MSEDNRLIKRLFKVASEFNVSTQSIVDSLAKSGFTIENKPNSKITSEMYEVLERTYSEDKARSREHERNREEYETRRSAILSSRNEKLTVNTLDPFDSLAPIDSLQPLPTQPVEIIPIPEPILQPAKPKVVEPSEEKPAPAQPEPQVKPVATEEKPAPVPPTSDAPPVRQVVSNRPAPVFKPAPKPVQAKPVVPEPEPEIVDEPVAEEEEIEVIRGRGERLKGTRVIGKIDVTPVVPVDEEEPLRRKKKKKKKVVASGKRDEATPLVRDVVKKDAKPATTTAAEDEEAKKKNKKKRVGKGDKRVSDADVDTKMKETMAILQGGGTGKKRQKRRKMKRDEMAAERELQDEMSREEGATIELSEFITVSDYADLLDVTVNQVITACMGLGMFVSINQRLDAASIELIAAEFDRDIRFVDAEQLSAEIVEEEDSAEDMLWRAPVVTVMGHVDHGKTSLLDYIRKTKVTAGEAGGITQHIGAYAVKLGDGRMITFLDTPGHEAFTAMRARGAQATDIVILVVAADDRVMPQTIEAINHAQAGGVPIVVAMNKVDKAEANTDKIRQQLSDYNVIVEEWGGKTQAAEVSAHTGHGIDSLLEKVLIEAELMELKANPNRRAAGVILETKVDKGKGVVANVLIQKGTLKVGDPFVAGQFYGRVRLMENEHGMKLDSAGPSTPIQLTGFDGLPQAGDRIMITPDEKTAKEIATQRQQIKRQQDLRKVKHLTLDDIARRMALGDIAELNLIVKGDVDGSIEALSGSLQKISNDEVQVNIIHTGVGAISESDVLLASASDAIIIGFQVRPTANARKLAEKEEIDIRLFSVIYDAVDAIKDALEGMLSPELGEKIIATVDIRETFKVPGVGTIAGCYVTEGKISRNSKIRLIRDGIVIFNGSLSSLKRFKDDVREVAAGYECGMGVNNYNDVRVGDVIEAYEITETKRKLSQ